MLTLSRPRRQALATIAVLVGLVGPTGYVVWMAWKVNRPAHRQEVERELARISGFQVGLGSVRYPEPGRIAFRDVALRPSGRGAVPPLALARTLNVRRDGRQWTIEADGLALSGGGPRALMGQIGDWLARTTATEFDEVHLIAPSCALDLGGGLAPFWLADLAATLRHDSAGHRLTASYRLDTERGAAQPRCELVLDRERRGSDVRTRLAFKTLDAPVATRVLDPFFGSADWLGPAARLEGELVLVQEGSRDWEAHFRGSIHDVDLAAVLRQVASEQRLAGRARLEVESARWADQPGRGPGWVEARGKLTGGPGLVSTGLLRALQGQLRFRVAPTDPGAAEQAFQALGLTFDLSPSGDLRFGGALGPEYLPGAVLVQGERFHPLATAPEAAGTVVSLVRALSPRLPSESDQLIPAHYESLVIQRFLPLPPQQAARPPSVPAP